MAIQNGLALAVIRNSSIHNNILPATVLEELEHGETVLDTIVDDQVVEELRVGALDQKRAKEPAVSEDTLFDISRSHGVTVHLWLTIRGDLLWSLPLDHWHVYGVLWWVHWVIVERAVVGRELRVSEKGIVIRADLDDLLNLVLDRVLLWLLLLRHVRLAHSAVIDHLVILLAHSIFVAHVLLCRKQLLILLLGHWLAIDVDKLLLPHLKRNTLNHNRF